MNQDAKVLTELEQEIVKAEQKAWGTHASQYVIYKIQRLRQEVVNLYREVV